jgi:hypothetical protein
LDEVLRRGSVSVAAELDVGSSRSEADTLESSLSVEI